MQATFQARIADETVYPVFDAIAHLYGRVERRLYVDLHVHGGSPGALKREYLARYGLTARQFNAVAVTLRGRMDAARESQAEQVAGLRVSVAATERAIGKLQKKYAVLGRRPRGQRFTHDVDRAATRWRLARSLHGKQRRLAALRARLAAAEADRAAKRVHLCFGSRKRFRAQFDLRANGYRDHAAWLADWRRARSSQFLCLGSHDESAGNQTCTLQPDGSLRLRVPPALQGRFGRWVAIPDVRFPYGQGDVEAAVAAGQPITYRFLRRQRKGRSVWYLHTTVDRPAAKVTTDGRLGALGVDLNPGHIEVAEVDRFGNPLGVRSLPVTLQGRRSAQVKAALGDAVADVVSQAQAAGKPIVVERLDFREKKARLREASDRQARMLSAFAYRQFHQLLRSRAAREGVAVLTVNPAYTSVIGFAKFGSGYGLSAHGAAAVAIARRGLGFGERLRSRSALPLPARTRGRHISTPRELVRAGTPEGAIGAVWPGGCGLLPVVGVPPRESMAGGYPYPWRRAQTRPAMVWLWTRDAIPRRKASAILFGRRRR